MSTIPNADIWNVPNRITVARLGISIICFVALAVGWHGAALVLFAVAAGTDWLDGYWARRYQQITQLGLILDPFADKLLICGVFTFLAAVPESEIWPWMAVVVVARELLVTGLRSFFEQQGVDFSASQAGKWKMVFQCAAVALSLLRLTYAQPTLAPEWMSVVLVAVVWIAIMLTIYSGWEYVRTALRLLRSNAHHG